jgi:Protein of unknown function (DUF5132)
MGLLEDAFKGWTGLAVGLGAAYAAPALAPAVGSIVRPLAKGIIKTGMVMAQSVREYAAEASEELGDIYAEARSESEQPERKLASGGARRAGRATAGAANDAPRQSRSRRR